eukprot:1040438-Prymnesium_polylepis.1
MNTCIVSEFGVSSEYIEIHTCICIYPTRLVMNVVLVPWCAALPSAAPAGLAAGGGAIQGRGLWSGRERVWCRALGGARAGSTHTTAGHA